MPAWIAMAVDNIEDPIDFVSDRFAETSAGEWSLDHGR